VSFVNLGRLTAPHERHIQINTTADNQTFKQVLDGSWLTILPIHFILMKLIDAAGKTRSENLYWRSAADPEDFTAFMQLGQVKLSGTVNVSTQGQEYVLIATVTNPADNVAFFIRLKVIKPPAVAGSDNRVLPTFYDDNYFTLMPGDKRTITMRCSQKDAGGCTASLG
jgi:exo-1,4-beta-D-glucosaminidase